MDDLSAVIPKARCHTGNVSRLGAKDCIWLAVKAHDYRGVQRRPSGRDIIVLEVPGTADVRVRVNKSIQGFQLARQQAYRFHLRVLWFPLPRPEMLPV